jgi:hypothetical protein
MTLYLLDLIIYIAPTSTHFLTIMELSQATSDLEHVFNQPMEIQQQLLHYLQCPHRRTYIHPHALPQYMAPRLVPSFAPITNCDSKENLLLLLQLPALDVASPSNTG